MLHWPSTRGQRKRAKRKNQVTPARASIFLPLFNSTPSSLYIDGATGKFAGAFPIKHKNATRKELPDLCYESRAVHAWEGDRLHSDLYAKQTQSRRKHTFFPPRHLKPLIASVQFPWQPKYSNQLTCAALGAAWGAGQRAILSVARLPSGMSDS